MNRVRVRDLPDTFGLPYPRPLLKCFVCGSESSAHKGDYFAARLDYVFKCCRRNMALVVKSDSYKSVAL